MRIISKFRDYYDNVVQDYEGRVWERNAYYVEFPSASYYRKQIDASATKMISVDLLNHSKPFNLSRVQQQFICDIYSDCPKLGDYFNPRHDNDSVIVFGLCGQVHYLILHRIGDRFDNRVRKVYTSFESYLLDFPDCNPTAHKFFRMGMWADEWDQVYKNNKRVEEVFHLLNTPTFIIARDTAPMLGICHVAQQRGPVLFINPKLRAYEIQRAFDPYSTYQDIDRFINNDLVISEDPNIKRTDDLIRDSKGMDKWSFRQQGPKARKR
jgi:hypothetical protein